MEKKITISNGKEYIISEILYKDVVENSSTATAEGTSKFLLQKSTNITDEEFATLTMKDGIKLQKAVNEINGLIEIPLSETPQE